MFQREILLLPNFPFLEQIASTHNPLRSVPWRSDKSVPSLLLTAACAPLRRADDRVWYGMVEVCEGMVWYGMVEVCEGAPVAVSGWVLTDRHDLGPCAASTLHRETTSVSN